MRPAALAFIVQALILISALFVVVLVPEKKEEPDFSAAPTVYLPQRELEHRMALAEFQQHAQPPVMRERLATSALLPDSLPELPSLPSLESAQLDAPLLDAHALLGQSGLLGALSDIRTEQSSVSFFGVETRAERIVICIDISTTVRNKIERAGYSMERVRKEAELLIEGLNANTLFGIVQHARNYDLFRDYLVAATVDNKAAALEWLRTEFRTDGTSGRNWQRRHPNGIQSVLTAAFELDPAPDLIFLVSDCEYYRTPANGGGQRVPWEEIANDLRRHQEGLARSARLHFFAFHMRPEDRSQAANIAQLYGGSVREFK